MSHVIALDLGATKLTAALFNEAADCKSRKNFFLEGRSGKAVGQLITDAVRLLMHEARKSNFHLSSIGICVPGISHSKTGDVWAPNIPGWENYPLKTEIEEATGAPNIKVVVDNDRSCSVLGERWKGAAIHCDHVVFMAVGTGIGAGIVADGHVIRGAFDIAGAAGWLALHQPYDLKYKACGCFEYYASGEGLVRAAKEFLETAESYNGPLLNNLNTKALFEAYEKGDVVAHKTMEQAIRFWGMTVANFVSIFNPEKIIFGGGVFGPALKFLPAIKQEAMQWAQPVSMGQVELTGSLLGTEAALYGAVYQALNL